MHSSRIQPGEKSKRNVGGLGKAQELTARTSGRQTQRRPETPRRRKARNEERILFLILLPRPTCLACSRRREQDTHWRACETSNSQPLRPVHRPGLLNSWPRQVRWSKRVTGKWESVRASRRMNSSKDVKKGLYLERDRPSTNLPFYCFIKSDLLQDLLCGCFLPRRTVCARSETACRKPIVDIRGI